MFPFKQKKNGNILIREFNKDIDSTDLVWHRDRSNRTVKILEGSGWQLQIDNEIPKTLLEGKEYYIPAYNYHRLIKGNTNLVIEIKENRMKITRRQLRRIIKEATAADLLKGIDTSGTGTPPKKDVIYVDETPYGLSILDSKREYKSLGEMILVLVDAGKGDFFHGFDDEKAMKKMMDKHEAGVQGGMQRWDAEVFEQYYNVDALRAVQMYADMFGLDIVYLEPEEEYR